MRRTLMQAAQERDALLMVPNQRPPRRFVPSPLMNLSPADVLVHVRRALNHMPRERGVTRG